jgi:hypothetical protein
MAANRKLGCLSIFLFVALCASLLVNLGLAAAFRRLLAHLGERSDVQNIDLMNLAGFCRNCLSKWYRAEAEARGHELSDAEAREPIYGMPYEDWKAKYQTDAKKPQGTPDS